MADDHPRPFFETRPAKAERGILLLSYHFPPSRAVGGVRWQKLSRFAAERGWQVDVVTLDPKDLETPDQGRLRELPEGVRVFGVAQPPVAVDELLTATWNATRRFRKTRVAQNSNHPPLSQTPTSSDSASISTDDLKWKFTSLSSARRAYSVWLDYAQYGGWAKAAARTAERIFRPAFHKVIVSCGPPHMVHEAARRVSRRNGVTFVVDMRDPWSLVERVPESLASPLLPFLASRYERKAVADAHLIVANTDPARQALASRYPEAQSRIITVMNGFDDDPLPPPGADQRFTLAYAGTVYLDRDPSHLFRAAAQVVKQFQLTPERFGFLFIGQIDAGYSIQGIAEREGLSPQFVAVEPACPRQQLWERLSHATVLVSLPQDSHMAIPSKIFEYMRFNAWLLALADPGSATEMMLRNTGADVVSPYDTEAIAAVLLERYRQFEAGARPLPLAKDERLSRATQAKIMLDAIEEILSK